MSDIDHDKVLETAASWLDQGHKVALATVVKTWRFRRAMFPRM